MSFTLLISFFSVVPAILYFTVTIFPSPYPSKDNAAVVALGREATTFAATGVSTCFVALVIPTSLVPSYNSIVISPFAKAVAAVVSIA